MITRCRFAPRFSHLPMIVSDSPPLFLGTHLEYMSAVSTALNPPATNASSKRNDVASSAVHPNTFPPNTMGAISSPEFPSFRLVSAMFFSKIVLSQVSQFGCPRRSVSYLLDENFDLIVREALRHITPPTDRSVRKCWMGLPASTRKCGRDFTGRPWQTILELPAFRRSASPVGRSRIVGAIAIFQPLSCKRW